MVQHSFFKLLSLLTLITDFPTSLAWKRPHHHPGHYDRHQRASSNAPPSRTKISSPTTLQDNQLGMSQALEGLSSLGIPSDTVKVGKLALGFLPDDGTTGGERQNMQEIMHALHEKQIGIYGFYAQVNNGELFNGYQFKWIMDDLRKSKAVFNPAVMPPKDWSGLTYQDNRQAVAIAKVCAKIHQEGIPVWLRAFHEANWYQRTHEYGGGPKEFKEAWDVLAKAVRQFAPGVLMHWSPNIAHNNNTSEYHEYQPYRFEETVDLVGIDYYPSSKPPPNHFIDSFKYFHDTFASERRKMVIGETGLHYPGSLQDKLDWLQQIANGKKELPYLVGVVWYNQKKGWDYKITGKGISNLLEAKLG